MYQGAAETDWGLPRPRPADLFRQLTYAATDIAYYFVAHRRGAARLRRIAARSDDGVRLSIGAGRHVPEGWIGIDRRTGANVVQCDLRRPLPLAAASVDAILAEHVLEHFPLDDLPIMLRDYHRVLKPRAPIRIVCPDALVVADLILGNDSERVRQQHRLDQRVYRWSDPATLRLKSANRLSHQYGQHHSLLTADLMCHLLVEAGFTDVGPATPDESRVFAVAPTTHFKRFPDSKSEAFVVEAVRPDIPEREVEA